MTNDAIATLPWQEDIDEPAGARTLAEYVFGRLRADIIYGRIKPGTKLRVESLKAVYGVSSSTLREALLMLVADTLATTEGQRGFRVSPLSLSDFAEVTRLRKVMETIALREAIERGDEVWEAGVVAAFHTLSRVDIRQMRKSVEVATTWRRLNHAFHEALVSASPSKRVREFRRILYQQSERYRVVHLAHANVRPGVRQEHKAIMDAALERDADLACALTEAHIERAYTTLAHLHARGKTDLVD